MRPYGPEPPPGFGENMDIDPVYDVDVEAAQFAENIVHHKKKKNKRLVVREDVFMTDPSSVLVKRKIDFTPNRPHLKFFKDLPRQTRINMYDTSIHNKKIVDMEALQRGAPEEALGALVSRNSMPENLVGIPYKKSNTMGNVRGVKPWGYVLHGVENLGPGNTLSTEHLALPVNDPKRVLAEIAYKHDVAYDKSHALAKIYGPASGRNRRARADREFAMAVHSYDKKHGTNLVRFVAKNVIGAKTALERYAGEIYDGNEWFPTTGGKLKRIGQVAGAIVTGYDIWRNRRRIMPPARRLTAGEI